MLAAEYKKKEDLQLHLQNNLINNDVKDPILLLALKVYAINARDLDQIVCST